VSSRNVCGVSGQRFRRTPAGVCSLGLHLVWCPTCRRRVLGGRVAPRLDEVIVEIADERGRQVVAREGMADHVHLFVRVGPADAPASVVGAFTGRTARVLRAECPQLPNFAKVLWSPSYVAASVGYVSERMVRRDLEHQCDAVLAS
jgi:putative transposase